MFKDFPVYCFLSLFLAEDYKKWAKEKAIQVEFCTLGTGEACREYQNFEGSHGKLILLHCISVGSIDKAPYHVCMYFFNSNSFCLVNL